MLNLEEIKKHALYVGLNDKDLRKQIISTQTCKEIIMDMVGDCTIIEATGRYTHDDGEPVTETTLIVEMLFKADNEVLSYLYQLKRKLNQESIQYRVDTVKSVLA